MFPYMVFCLFCLLLFYFLFSLSKMARPQFLYYYVRIYEKSLQPRGKVSLVLVETATAASLHNRIVRVIEARLNNIVAFLSSSCHFIPHRKGWRVMFCIRSGESMISSLSFSIAHAA
jgi:hypothetical protein